jgi:hypothetical protein
MARSLAALARLAVLALLVWLAADQALAAGWSARLTLGVLGGLVLFGAGVALLIVLDWRHLAYSTDAGERDADRALAAGWPDDQDLDPGDCR